MKIGFHIDNISDPDNGPPFIVRYATLRILPKDLELPIEEFIARYVRPTVEQCVTEFNDEVTAATAGVEFLPEPAEPPAQPD